MYQNVQNFESHPLQPPERRLRHRGGRDGGAGAIVLIFEKGGAGGSGTRRVVPEGVAAACRSKMASWAIERAERARRRRGGEENGGEAASIPSFVRVAAALDD